MKNRLKALLCNVVCRGDDRREGGCGLRKDDRCDRIEKLDMCMIECITDHLLAEGVIVPPCKVGDVVYGFRECSCEDIDGAYTQCEFYGYGLEDRICTIPTGKKCPHQYRIEKYSVTEANILMFTRMWGKTVFLTREEAEKALAERSGQ